MLLHSSSPFTCSTPSRSSYYSSRSHQPLTSSPLASPTFSSPTHEAQQRRRAQYKSMTPPSYRSITSASAKLLFRPGNQTSEDPQKSFLRERLQARCREHTQKLRERVVSARRSSDKYSDVFMDCDDEEESDDVVMQDELFRRIVQNANHKQKHAYRVSYAMEVGSSFDPDMEDPSSWESELRGRSKSRTIFSSPLISLPDPQSSSTEPTPDDFDEEFLEYAEKRAALADFADLDLAANYSDFDDLTSDVPLQIRQPQDTGPMSDMDVS